MESRGTLIVLSAPGIMLRGMASAQRDGTASRTGFTLARRAHVSYLFEQAFEIAETRMSYARMGVAATPPGMAAEVREVGHALDAMRRAKGGERGAVAERVRVAALSLAASAVLIAEATERRR